MTVGARLGTRPGRGVGPRDARGRARALGAVAGAVVAVLALAALMASGALWGDDGLTGPTATQEFESYLAEVEPLAKDAGRVVQLGLKAGITDIGDGKYADEVLIGMADGWAGELEALREQLTDVTPPRTLSGAHARLVEGFDGYLAVAATLDEAARAPAAERAGLVDRAARQGEVADDTWDRGAAALQARARDLGLPAVSWLPHTDDGGDS